MANSATAMPVRAPPGTWNAHTAPKRSVQASQVSTLPAAAHARATAPKARRRTNRAGSAANLAATMPPSPPSPSNRPLTIQMRSRL